MKRLLLLNPPGKRPYIRDNYCSYSGKANYFWEPIDLLVQSGWLAEDYELTVMDAIAEGLDPDRVVDQARTGRFDAILSMIGGVSLDEDRALFTRLKEATGAVLAVSGDVCLTGPEKLLDIVDALDAVLTDYTTGDLTAFLKADKPGTRGTLAYRNQGEVVAVDRTKPPPMEMDYPVPRHEVFPIHLYRISTSLKRRFATCIASLGCAFNCPFCICSLMSLRLRSMDSLINELHAIKAMGIQEVYFYDPYFTVKQSRCVEMLETIRQADLNLVYSCNSHISVSEQILDLLTQTGCHTIMFGIETADEALLTRYSKRISQDKVRLTLERCRDRGIRTFGYFMIGLPDETEKSILDTIQYATDLPLHYASFNFPSPVVGTELFKEVCEKGLLDPEAKNLDRSSEVSFAPKGMSAKRLQELKRLAYRRFYLRPLFLLKTLRTLFPFGKWGFFLKDVLTFFRRNFL